MPRVEVDLDETEIANLADMRRTYQVAQMIGKNPAARAKLQESVALAAPDQVGPEHRIRSEVQEALSGIRDELKADREARQKERDDEIAERNKRALENRWMTGRSKAREAGYTDEGLGKLEEFMEKNGVADHELAIPAFERLNPPPEPLMTGGTRWNFFDAKDQAGGIDLKPLMDGDEDTFLGKAIGQALKDVRGR